MKSMRQRWLYKVLQADEDHRETTTHPLAGQLALVTGSSRGIGAGIAVALAQAGASVIVHGFNHLPEAEAVAARCRSFGGYAQVCAGDVRSEVDVAALFARIKNMAGTPSIVVHNAGVAATGLLTDMSAAEWDDMQAVHLRGAFLCARAALPAMARARYGRLIFISSVWGIVGAAGEAAYAAAKGGQIALARSLAKEWGLAGITVNTIAPGAVATDLLADYEPDDLQEIIVHTPAGRLGSPDDIGAAVVYLASREAGYVTGQVITADGGWTLN